MTPTNPPPATVEVLAQLLDHHCAEAIAAEGDADPATMRRLVDNLLWHLQEIGFCPPLKPAKDPFAAWMEKTGWEVDGNVARWPGDHP